MLPVALPVGGLLPVALPVGGVEPAAPVGGTVVGAPLVWTPLGVPAGLATSPCGRVDPQLIPALAVAVEGTAGEVLEAPAFTDDPGRAPGVVVCAVDPAAVGVPIEPVPVEVVPTHGCVVVVPSPPTEVLWLTEEFDPGVVATPPVVLCVPSVEPVPV